jgi:hypothetical protein
VAAGNNVSVVNVRTLLLEPFGEIAQRFELI